MYPEKLDSTTIPDASVRARIRIERQIVRALIDELLTTGFELSVFDGEDDSGWTTKRPEVIAAIMNTDEDYLNVRRHNGGFRMVKTENGGTAVVKSYIQGWVRLIYGNDGWDVMSDYTCNLEDGGHISKTLALAERLGG